MISKDNIIKVPFQQGLRLSLSRLSVFDWQTILSTLLNTFKFFPTGSQPLIRVRLASNTMAVEPSSSAGITTMVQKKMILKPYYNYGVEKMITDSKKTL